MNKKHVIEMLEKHLKSNDWMILAVGNSSYPADHDHFQIGQTLHNNQDAVVELVGYGYFPEGTIFAVRPRPRRKGDVNATLLFTEVIGCDIVHNELSEIFDRVNWSRVCNLISVRTRRQKRMAENRAFELEMQKELRLEIQIFASDPS